MDILHGSGKILMAEVSLRETELKGEKMKKFFVFWTAVALVAGFLFASDIRGYLVEKEEQKKDICRTGFKFKNPELLKQCDRINIDAMDFMGDYLVRVGFVYFFWIIPLFAVDKISAARQRKKGRPL